MERIRVIKLGKAFGIREIFKDISFELKRGDRLGLVGPNGGGKSTLLKCLLTIEEPDEGQMIISDGATIGYLQQEVNLGDESLRQEVDKAWQDVHELEARIQSCTEQMETGEASEADLERLANLQERLEWLGGYDYERRCKQIIYGLGFTDEDMDKPASAFSGGQKTRINLAKALVRQPDFLFLDEPTNHLDTDMLEWLESYLASYGGGILVVSHDRYFLDRVATGILELEHGKLTVYRGNYSRYLTQKESNVKAAQKAYDKQQEYIKATEAYIDKYRAGIKSKMARGRQSQLNRLERLEAPELSHNLSFHFPEVKFCADKVLTVTDLTVSYGGDPIFENLRLALRRGDSVALIGPNGAGKSTLVKTITGELEALEGQIDIGNRVQIGYFSQEHEELHPHWSAMEEITNNFSMGDQEARSALGRFLFRGDDVFRLVGDMSGGERARLALLKLFLEGDNFLILDEPTNHLDIPTREIVEAALLDFGGTYLIISHDRYFLDKIAKRTILLQDGKTVEYLGNYTYFKEKEKEKADLEALKASEEKDKASSTANASKGLDGAPVKEELTKAVGENKATRVSTGAMTDKGKAGKGAPLKTNAYMWEKQVADIEMTIARLEATVKMYEKELSFIDVVNDYGAYEAKVKELTSSQSDLEKAYERWEGLMNQAE